MPAPLPADAVAVRGGESRDPDAVMRKLLDNIADGEGPRLSIHCIQRGDGDDPKITDAEQFIGCFDEPIPNPTGGKRRGRPR